MTPRSVDRLSLVERAQFLAMRVLGHLPARMLHALSGLKPIVIDGQTLDVQAQLSEAFRRRHRHGLCEPSLPLARARFRRENVVLRGARTAVASVRDFTIPGKGSLIALRHYAPREGRQPLLVYLHGGGSVIGDLETHDETCRLLCQHGRMNVLSVEYRLAPEHPFPAALDDAAIALRWAAERAPMLDAASRRLAIGGDGAGGNLAAVTARLAAREGLSLAGQLLIYPATDAGPAMASNELFGDGFFLTSRDRQAFQDHYLSGMAVDPRDPRVAPLGAPDQKELPPALVVTAGFDILRDEGEAYAEALRAAGNTVRSFRIAELGHGFLHMTGVCNAAKAAVIRIASEFRALLEGTPAITTPSARPAFVK